MTDKHVRLFVWEQAIYINDRARWWGLAPCDLPMMHRVSVAVVEITGHLLPVGMTEVGKMASPDCESLLEACCGQDGWKYTRRNVG